jgi:hypothetical protein
MTEPARRPHRYEFAALRLWHAVLAGGFVVAYVTADEDTYAMHLFAGYLVLAALALRLAVGVLAPESSPLRLARRRKAVFNWMAAVVLAAVAAAGLTGWLADAVPAVEDLHEGLSQTSLWVVVGHGALVWFLMGGRALMAKLASSSSKA